MIFSIVPFSEDEAAIEDLNLYLFDKNRRQTDLSKLSGAVTDQSG